MNTTCEIFTYVPVDPPEGWKREMGILGWNGDDLYIPAGAAGIIDLEAFMRLAYDGIEVCIYGDVLLIPEKWARREQPDRQQIFDVIRKRAIEIRERFSHLAEAN